MKFFVGAGDAGTHDTTETNERVFRNRIMLTSLRRRMHVHDRTVRYCFSEGTAVWASFARYCCNRRWNSSGVILGLEKRKPWTLSALCRACIAPAAGLYTRAWPPPARSAGIFPPAAPSASIAAVMGGEGRSAVSPLYSTPRYAIMPRPVPADSSMPTILG